jgi:hypothetical protein
MSPGRGHRIGAFGESLRKTNGSSATRRPSGENDVVTAVACRPDFFHYLKIP